MTNYFYQYFNIFEFCMTKFVDFNVYSRNFFEESLPEPIPIDQGEDVNPAQVTLLEDYVPVDEQMQEQLEEEFEESERDSFGSIEVPDKDDLQKEDN